MTADEPTTDPGETEDHAPSRAAGGCVAIILAGALLALAYAVPETVYFAAGVVAAAAVRKARTWSALRRGNAAEEEPAPFVDVAETLRGLSPDGRGVLLTQLQKATALPDTKAVRALLGEAGIRVRTGVRTPAGNGPGVHADDIPPAETETPSGRCLCSSGANANANNAASADSREGLRVEAIGEAGAIVHDPSETHRHHQVRTH